MKNQELIGELLAKNPEIQTVLTVAEQARIAENLKSPIEIVYPTDVVPNPRPEHQGSLVIPAATRRA